MLQTCYKGGGGAQAKRPRKSIASLGFLTTSQKLHTIPDRPAPRYTHEPAQMCIPCKLCVNVV
jgi:hypothetical protein